MGNMYKDQNDASNTLLHNSASDLVGFLNGRSDANGKFYTANQGGVKTQDSIIHNLNTDEISVLDKMFRENPGLAQAMKDVGEQGRNRETIAGANDRAMIESGDKRYATDGNVYARTYATDVGSTDKRYATDGNVSARMYATDNKVTSGGGGSAKATAVGGTRIYGKDYLAAAKITGRSQTALLSAVAQAEASVKKGGAHEGQDSYLVASGFWNSPTGLAEAKRLGLNPTTMAKYTQGYMQGKVVGGSTGKAPAAKSPQAKVLKL
jgi:hypothetical protein